MDEREELRKACDALQQIIVSTTKQLQQRIDQYHQPHEIKADPMQITSGGGMQPVLAPMLIALVNGLAALRNS